jgi:acylphosphatase
MLADSHWCVLPAIRILSSLPRGSAITPRPATGVGMLVPVLRYRVTVSGRVQGVWYRQSCRRVAQALGVNGWVRNNIDGTVEAVLEGDPAAVEEVLAWMRAGPPQAVVVRVNHQEEAATGESTFAVR